MGQRSRSDTCKHSPELPALTLPTLSAASMHGTPRSQDPTHLSTPKGQQQPTTEVQRPNKPPQDCIRGRRVGASNGPPCQAGPGNARERREPRAAGQGVAGVAGSVDWCLHASCTNRQDPTQRLPSTASLPLSPSELTGYRFANPRTNKSKQNISSRTSRCPSRDVLRKQRLAQ